MWILAVLSGFVGRMKDFTGSVFRALNFLGCYMLGVTAFYVGFLQG